MIDPEKLEREVATLIREHVTVGYSYDAGHHIDPDSIFTATEGAAYVVVHHMRKALTGDDRA